MIGFFVATENKFQNPDHVSSTGSNFSAGNVMQKGCSNTQTHTISLTPHPKIKQS